MPTAGAFRNGGVSFVFPDGADGKQNNLTSRGAVMKPPRGRYRRLRILESFHQLADVDLDRELVSLKMPTQGWPVLHIFALSLEKPGQ